MRVCKSAAVDCDDALRKCYHRAEADVEVIGVWYINFFMWECLCKRLSDRVGVGTTMQGENSWCRQCRFSIMEK